MQEEKMKRHFKMQLLTIAGLLIVIVIVFSLLCIYIAQYNKAGREYSDGDECGAFTVSLAPRGGATDSWIKTVETDAETVTYLGTIYDATIINTGNRLISSWDMRIDIPEDCFLNNAWCGKVEIHQNVSVSEKTQIVDLRNYNAEELTVDYVLMGNDLMIPLSQGDYLVYLPDEITNEYPINIDGGGSLFSTTVGLILYSYGDQAVEIEADHINYTLKMTYSQSPMFWILLAACFAWIILVVACVSVGLSMKNAHKRFDQDDQIIRQSIKVFTGFFEAKDIYTSGHSQRVASYTRLICERLGMSEELCRRYYYIGLMHDCGKCYIPDEILKKPDKLTPEEYDVIKSHTVKGAEMLADFSSIPEIREGVLHHHERYDGGGYPNGLTGEHIPLVGRIICISDSFDAMNSRRSYRKPLSDEYILSEISNNSGKQFDPKLVLVFMKLISDGKIILNHQTGQQAED